MIAKGIISIILTIVVAFIFCCCMGSCRGTKKLTHKESEYSAATLDTANSADTSMKRLTLEDMWRYSHSEETTSEPVPGSSVSLTEAKDSPRDTTVKSGNTTLTTHTDKKGNRTIECKADSLQRIITRKTKDSTMQSRRYDSLYAIKSLVDKRSESVSTLRDVVETEQRGWWGAAKGIFILSLIVAIVFFCIGYMCKSHVDKWRV